jgi:hypothetical protein
MVKLGYVLLAVGMSMSVNTSFGQDVASDIDKAKGQEQKTPQREGAGTNSQTESNQPNFEQGKPQQSEADRGETGRNDTNEKVHHDQGKPDQSDASQQKNQQDQSQRR